jgi:hypothetical protein
MVKNKLDGIEKILQKEGYVDWEGGALQRGEKLTLNYDEQIIIIKKRPEGNYYVRVYAEKKFHRRYIKQLPYYTGYYPCVNTDQRSTRTLADAIGKQIKIEKRKPMPGEAYDGRNRHN